MVIEIHPTFTLEEKVEFLTQIGYNISHTDIDVWEQWGNHDSQGNWTTKNIICAIKEGESANVYNKIDDIFKVEIAKKIKRLLLN